MAAPKPKDMDARTLVRHLWVSLPLLKVANADQGLIDLFLNSLIVAKTRHGKAMMVPHDTSIDKMPTPLFTQELKILTES